MYWLFRSAPARVCGVAAFALLDLWLPEHCAVCADAADHAGWEEPGPRAPGLRPWDRPHLCRACAAGLFGQPLFGALEGSDVEPGLPVYAAAATSARLANVIGLWKYHGVRGLAWPLGRALARAAGEEPCGDVLVPVPLHAARRRHRGFNQAALLAQVAGPLLGLPVEASALRRVRATAQQARLDDAGARAANLAGAFHALSPTGPRRALLVDDLVTAGATARAAAAALRAAGWEVAGVLALGLALGRNADQGDFVDTIWGAS